MRYNCFTGTNVLMLQGTGGGRYAGEAYEGIQGKPREG